MPALDVIRSVAILLVIAHHVSFNFAPSQGDVVARFLRSAGWAGVDIFFALSGFLIAKILLSSTGDATAEVRRFFIRRFFRIVPLYMAALSVFIAASFWLGGESLNGVWITALMLNGWFIPFLGVDNVPFTITWSISVEEFAYAMLGLSLLASIRMVKVTIFAFIGCALVIRVAIHGLEWFDTSSIYYFVPARLDSIGFGALVAMGLFPARWSNRSSVVLIATCLLGLLVVFALVPRAHGLYPLVGYAAFGIACASLVGAVSQQSWGTPGWLAKSLAWVGQVSYFLYLFHMFVIALVRRVVDSLPWSDLPYWPALAVVLTFSSVAAWVSWRIFEAPMIALGRRLTP